MGDRPPLLPFLVYDCVHVCRHTGVVVYGQEFFYGGMGIESCPPVSSNYYSSVMCNLGMFAGVVHLYQDWV